MKKCFYETLGVEKTATTDEIKKAYKRKALTHHPDKNQDEDTKEIFQEISEAYQILSDPNERSWYDNHRNQILAEKEKYSQEDAENENFGGNIKKYYTSDCYDGFHDGENGFYKVYRDLFQYIAMHEQSASEEKGNESDYRKPPGFGDSLTDIEFVEKFYIFWEYFSTSKSFSYADYWKLSDGESREIRRLMEKDNKKYREAEKKSYVKKIRTLVEFVQKKDPRYKKLIAHQIAEVKRKEQVRKQKELDKIAERKETLIRAREEEQRRFAETAHLYVDEEEINENLIDDEFHCSVCNKSFKSEKQLHNHEKSKIHMKNVKDIMKQVADFKEIQEMEEAMSDKKKKTQSTKVNGQLSEKEEEEEKSDIKENVEKKKNLSKKQRNKLKKNKNVNIETEDSQPMPENHGNPDKNEKNFQSRFNFEHESESEESEKEEPKIVEMKKKDKKKKNQIPKKVSSSEEDSEDEIDFSKLLKKPKKNSDDEDIIPHINNKNEKKESKKEKEKQAHLEEEKENEKKKIGMAKLKREKKKEVEEKFGKDVQMCGVCGLKFPSKTKLFAHIKEKGHAQAK